MYLCVSSTPVKVEKGSHRSQCKKTMMNKIETTNKTRGRGLPESKRVGGQI
jgi:hypothetical protein